MFKKFSSGILIIVLIALLAVYVIIRYTGSNDRSFKEKVLTFEPAAITGITIKDPKSNLDPVELRLAGDRWMVKSGVKEYAADTNTVKNLLNLLSDLPTKRYAGKGKDAWVKYEVTDTSGTLVTLKSSGKTVAELLIGKFSYNMPKDQQQQMQYRQQKGDMTSFVRLADEKDVYAVDGYLKMSFSGKPETYRIRSITGVNPSDITRLTVRQPGIEKVLDNTSGKWMMNGMPVDSTSAVRYRSLVSRLTGTKFTEPEMVQSAPSYSLLIEGNNFSPVEIKAFPVADTNIAYVINSTANPESYFEGKTGGLFKRIWQDKILE